MDTFGSELAGPDCRGSGVTLWGASSGVGLLIEPASGLRLGWLWGAAGASSGLWPPTVFTVTSTAGGTVSARGSGCWGVLGTAAASAFCEVVQKCLITRADTLWCSTNKCYYLYSPSTMVCSSLVPTVYSDSNSQSPASTFNSSCRSTNGMRELGISSRTSFHC